MSREFGSELSLFMGNAVELRANTPGAGPYGQEGPGYVLAPYATSLDRRTQILQGLVESLVEVGAIPKQALRNELQVTECPHQ